MNNAKLTHLRSPGLDPEPFPKAIDNKVSLRLWEPVFTHTDESGIFESVRGQIDEHRGSS